MQPGNAVVGDGVPRAADLDAPAAVPVGGVVVEVADALDGWSHGRHCAICPCANLVFHNLVVGGAGVRINGGGIRAGYGVVADNVVAGEDTDAACGQPLGLVRGAELDGLPIATETQPDIFKQVAIFF